MQNIVVYFNSYLTIGNKIYFGIFGVKHRINEANCQTGQPL